MQDESDKLIHKQLIHSVVAWTRWWRLTSKLLVLVFRKRAWGVIGAFLRQEKPLHRTDQRIATLRENWSRRGRELDAIKTRGQA